MKKIVISQSYGGYGLSNLAVKRLSEIAERPFTRSEAEELSRDDEDLVRVIEMLGKGADGPFARLKIVEIPDDVEWYINEYDGSEWIAEKHRTWR